MFSPQFFTVTPEDSNGRRAFLPNSPGLPINMNLRATELGPHGLPVVLARTGQVVEVQREKPGQKPPSVLMTNGKLIQINNIKKTPDGKLQLFNQSGTQVQPQMLKLAPVVRKRVMLTPDRPTAVVTAAVFKSAIQARKIIFNKIPIFVDPAGNVIDVEPGQADSGVLISQNGSLIYYITAVNEKPHKTPFGALSKYSDIHKYRRFEMALTAYRSPSSEIIEK